MLVISLSVACSRYTYDGVILHTHPVRSESYNQRNTTGEVATEDNMVDCLLFCATLTGRRGCHVLFVQAGAETSNTGVEAVKPDCPPTPHSIDDPPTAPHLWCCCQMN